MRDIARLDQIRDDEEERRRCRSVTPVIPPDALISEPSELVSRDVTPNSIAEWKAVADGFLTNESCAFHRNVEISSRYAWLYKLMPACFKWAGMAAIASHHVQGWRSEIGKSVPSDITPVEGIGEQGAA